MGSYFSNKLNKGLNHNLDANLLTNGVYRMLVVNAFCHHYQQILVNHYINTEYMLYITIPNVIKKIIVKYYYKHQIHYISFQSKKIRHIPELEEIVYDFNKIYWAQNKLFVKDFSNQLHTKLISKNNKNIKNNEYTIAQAHRSNSQIILHDCTCFPFRDLMHINDIQLISHSLYNNYYNIIKLENKSIFIKTNKKQNGYRQISFFKRKQLHVTKIECGDEHCLFLTSNGSVYSMGKNNEGQCGITTSSTKYINNPTLIKTFKNNNIIIKSISSGCYHNSCIDNRGCLWTFGSNDCHQCNSDNNKVLYTPQKHNGFGFKKMLKAESGLDFTVCLSNKRYLYGFGNIRGIKALNIRDVYLLFDNKFKNENVINFDVGCSDVVWYTNKNKVYSMEAKKPRLFKSLSSYNKDVPFCWNDNNKYKLSHINTIIVNKHHFMVIST